MRCYRSGHQLDQSVHNLSKTHAVIVGVLSRFVVKEGSCGSCFLTVQFGRLLDLGSLAKTCSDLSLFGTMASSIVMWNPPCIAGLVSVLYLHKLA